MDLRLHPEDLNRLADLVAEKLAHNKVIHGVLNAAWDAKVAVAEKRAHEYYDKLSFEADLRESFEKLLKQDGQKVVNRAVDAAMSTTFVDGNTLERAIRAGVKRVIVDEIDSLRRAAEDSL